MWGWISVFRDIKSGRFKITQTNNPWQTLHPSTQKSRILAFGKFHINTRGKVKLYFDIWVCHVLWGFHSRAGFREGCSGDFLVLPVLPVKEPVWASGHSRKTRLWHCPLPGWLCIPGEQRVMSGAQSEQIVSGEDQPQPSQSQFQLKFAEK